MLRGVIFPRKRKKLKKGGDDGDHLSAVSGTDLWDYTLAEKALQNWRCLAREEPGVGGIWAGELFCYSSSSVVGPHRRT